MSPLRRRVGLLSAVVLPAALLLGIGRRVDAQYKPPTFERTWKCSKCGGYLGNGVKAPDYCHHCKIRLRGSRDNTADWNRTPQSSPKSARPAEPTSPFGIAAAVILALLAIGALGWLVLHSKPNP
jgi:hypothetical protein